LDENVTPALFLATAVVNVALAPIAASMEAAEAAARTRVRNLSTTL
jgi:hypothetical protein